MRDLKQVARYQGLVAPPKRALQRCRVAWGRELMEIEPQAAVGRAPAARLDFLSVVVFRGIVNRGERRDQVRGLLVRTNLWGQRKKAAAGFSGGMRRRFGIAQALLGAARLLVVDEPTAGLVPEERQRFLDLIAELSEDVIVILSTHWIEDVREFFPQMARLDAARVLYTGPQEDDVRALEGQIWTRRCGREEVEWLEQESTVISRRRRSGKVVLNVLASDCPPGFETVAQTLEDAYFSALHTAELPADSAMNSRERPPRTMS